MVLEAKEGSQMTCKIGRTYDSNHPTCRSCELQEVALCRGQLQAKSSKYKSKKVALDGITFDSKKEAARWYQLKIMEKAGAISDLQRQVVFELQPAAVINGRKKPRLKYLSDFTYLENGKLVVEDVKSAATKKLSTYRVKLHLMKTIHNIEIKES